MKKPRKLLKIKNRHLTIAALVAGEDEDNMVTLLNTDFRYLTNHEIRMVNDFVLFTSIQSTPGTPLFLEAQSYLERLMKHVQRSVIVP